MVRTSFSSKLHNKINGKENNRSDSLKIERWRKITVAGACFSSISHNRNGEAEEEEEQDAGDFVEMDPSKRYGRYAEVLGKGAFKTVYRGFDKVEGIEVAWNQVKLRDVGDDQFTKEFVPHIQQEVWLLKRLKHSNILKLHSSWFDQSLGVANFITELFVSGTLREYRKKHKHVELKAVKKWARQILQGLDYLHSQHPPIIHRDMKCDNIFINGNSGEVKIGDLGFATILHNAEFSRSVRGTPEFMAPELYQEEYNELVDIYSFGMCMLEMMTMEFPYSECKNVAQIFRKVVSGVKPLALSKVKDPKVRHFIESCLAPVSSRPSAKELLMDPFLQDEHVPDLQCSNGNNSCLHQDVHPVLDPKTGRSKRNASQALEDVVQKLDGTLQQTCTNSKHSHVTPVNQETRIITVKGTLLHDKTVNLSLRIVEQAPHVGNIHFSFHLQNDTPMSVAKEMVHELLFADKDMAILADMIYAEIKALVPDWSTSVADRQQQQR